MRHFHRAAHVVAVVIGLTSVASAAPLPVYSWAGWYIGGNTGWVGSERNITNTGTDTGTNGLGTALRQGNIPASVDLSNNGFIGGGQIGYNWQAGNWVYGFEADFDGASAESSTTVTQPPNIAHGGGATFNRELDWLATIRGRIGITATPSFLLFATGGLAVGQTKIGNFVFCPMCPQPVDTINQNTNTSAGWTVGAGAEWMFAPRWSLKAEYLYVDLGSHSSTITAAYAGPNTSTLTSTFRDSENIVRGGINYHFQN
jgi:outer membrane immunogenic protein